MGWNDVRRRAASAMKMPTGAADRPSWRALLSRRARAKIREPTNEH